VGKTGTGKSHLIKNALKQNRFGYRVLIIDIQDEFGNIEGFENEKSISNAIRESRKGVKNFKWRFVTDPDSKNIEDVFRLGFALGECTIIAEEVGAYKYSSGLERVALRGRSRGIQLIVSTQRPYTVSRTVSSQVATGIIFATDEPRDLKYVAERWSWSEAHKILNLKKYEANVVGETKNARNFFVQKLNVKQRGERKNETVAK